jgi:hypothetical protein
MPYIGPDGQRYNSREAYNDYWARMRESAEHRTRAHRKNNRANRNAIGRHLGETLERSTSGIPKAQRRHEAAMRESPGYRQVKEMEEGAMNLPSGSSRIKKISARSGLPLAIANIAQQRNLPHNEKDVERVEEINHPMARRPGGMIDRFPGQTVQFRKNANNKWVPNRDVPLQGNLGSISAPDAIREGNDPRQRYLQHKERMGLTPPTVQPEESINERREKMGLQPNMMNWPAAPRPRNIQEGRQALNKNLFPDEGLPAYAAALYNSNSGLPDRRNREAVGYRDNLLANGSMSGELPGYEKQPYRPSQTPPAELGRFKQPPRPENLQKEQLSNAIGNLYGEPERNTRYDYIPPRLRNPEDGTDLLNIEPDEE